MLKEWGRGRGKQKEKEWTLGSVWMWSYGGHVLVYGKPYAALFWIMENNIYRNPESLGSAVFYYLRFVRWVMGLPGPQEWFLNCLALWLNLPIEFNTVSNFSKASKHLWFLVLQGAKGILRLLCYLCWIYIPVIVFTSSTNKHMV